MAIPIGSRVEGAGTLDLLTVGRGRGLLAFERTESIARPSRAAPAVSARRRFFRRDAAPG
jgi:hypothetical protein